MRYRFFIIVTLLVAAVFLAGCTDEEHSPIAETLSAEPALPGQALVLVGDVTGDGLAGGTIDTIDITVALVPGARPIDMEKISIVYADTIKTETLIPVEGYWGNPPQGCWGILNVVGQVGDQNSRIEDREQFVIRLNPRAYLPAKRMAVIVVRAPAVATPLTIRRFAPAEIVAQGNILTPP
ncbi:hypothetical protein [Methanoregula sp.]|uniref:hypothetical protein n=1 Tax=Methanoregula sp. TaxID=2052170 RepID=UPI000CBF9349|nr:hypothetical protein [Methanoregula sp.]PKG32964.1 MAG: hypothetical protein CW742_05430 [Methanoregula sp.]